MQALWRRRSWCRAGDGLEQTSQGHAGCSSVTLAGIGNRPPELHKGQINIDPASVHTAATIDADIRAVSCTTVAFAPVEDDTHVTPVLKLSAQFFISVQPGTGYDEDEHVSTAWSCALRAPLVVTSHLGCGGAGGLGGGRRGGRVGFGRGGAGALLRRSPPSRF